MTNIKADLHMHGPIGFQKYWLKNQGYQGKNLLKEISDSCFKKDIGLTVITSEEDEIPKNSIHDRFGWLKNQYANELPKGYKFNSLGDNVGVIEKENQLLYLVNAQTVRTNRNGNNIGVIVVGKNDILNHGHFNIMIDKLSRKEDLILGSGYELFKYDEIDNVVDKIDYIEGFNSQLLPWQNWNFKKFAEKFRKSWVAVSDAHRIEDAGKSYIEFDERLLKNSGEKEFIGSLKNLIKNDEFVSHCHYENPIDWINWVSKFRKGIKAQEYKELKQ